MVIGDPALKGRRGRDWHGFVVAIWIGRRVPRFTSSDCEGVSWPATGQIPWLEREVGLGRSNLGYVMPRVLITWVESESGWFRKVLECARI